MNRIATIAAATALCLAPAMTLAGESPAPAKVAPAQPMKVVPAQPGKAAASARAAEPAPSPKPQAAPRKEAKPATVPVTAPAPEKVAVQAADKPRRGPSRAHEDARSCLELATNREIAICAEKFR